MSTGRVDTVRLQNMSRAFITSASLFAAIDLELFTAVSQGDHTVAAFAARAGISQINADRLMTMCAAAALLEWKGDHFENAEDVQRYLVKGEETYAGAWLTFTRPGWTNWGNLTEKLKNWTPPKMLGDYDSMTVERARRYHEATASVGFGAGRRFARQVDLSGRRKMMDLGGGSGAYSIVAVQKYPGLRAVVLDLPPVVEVTREFIRRHAVEDRVTAQACDFTSDEFPADCDVAVMASNLPQYDRETIATVIRKAHEALLPGGEMHLVGEMLDDSRDGPLDAAIWGLMETMSNSMGMAHTRAECCSYFERAGFENVCADDFIPGVLARVSGTKRAQ